jgi:hypothetical protein
MASHLISLPLNPLIVSTIMQTHQPKHHAHSA